MRVSDFARNIIQTICLFTLAACGSSGDGPETTQNPPPVSTPPPGFVTVAGSVSVDGVAADSLTIVALGRESSVAADGSFEAFVYENGVAMLVAMQPGKDFGPMTIIATDGTGSSAPITIDARSTATSLVFLAPQFVAVNPESARQVLSDIASSPSLQPLVEAVEAAFADINPLENAALTGAWSTAVAAIANEISQSGTGVQPQAEMQASRITAMPVLHLPLALSANAGEGIAANATSYSIDLDYTTVNVIARGDTYILDPDSARVLGLVSPNAVDWLSEIGQIDYSLFSNQSTFEATTTDPFALYPRTPASNSEIGQDIIAAEGYVRVFDFGTWLFDSALRFAENRLDPDGIPVSATADGIYVIRSFSGGWAGDPQERSFVLNDVPNGETNQRKARATNYVSMSVEVISIVLDIQALLSDSATKNCMDSAILAIWQETSTSIEITGSVTSELITGKDVIVSTFEASLKCVGNAGLSTLVKWMLKNMWGIDIDGPWVDLAILTERIGKLIFTVSPLESAVIMVGTPLVDDNLAPTIPTGLTATATTTSDINLQWNESTDEGSGVAGYRIYRGDVFIANVLTTTYVDTGLLAGTQYCYEVEAFDFGGNFSGRSTPECATTLSTDDTTPPSIPQGVEAVASGVDQISISWSPSTDDSGSVASYDLYRDTVFVATVTETSAVDTGLSAGTEYCYTVSARDSSGNPSDPSAPPACATTQAEARFAETGWTVVAAGDPGIPGDGILVGNDVDCGGSVCWTGDRPAVKLLRPESDGYTVSLYMTNIFDAIPLFDFLGSPLGRCNFFPGAFYEGRSTAPTINGVSGESFSYSRATLQQIAADIRINRPQDCATVSEEDVYVYLVQATSSGNSSVDGIYIGTGENVFPEPPGQDPGWVSFVEGNAGVPGDGLTVTGSPRHTITSPVRTLGSTADGLTISIYGANPATFDELVIGYSGYPGCSYTLPLLGGALNDAPPYTGVTGKFYAINRQFLAQFAGVVAATNPAQCANVSADESYFTSFILGGSPYQLDAAFIASGFVEFP